MKNKLIILLLTKNKFWLHFAIAFGDTNWRNFTLSVKMVLNISSTPVEVSFVDGEETHFIFL